MPSTICPPPARARWDVKRAEANRQPVIIAGGPVMIQRANQGPDMASPEIVICLIKEHKVS